MQQKVTKIKKMLNQATELQTSLQVMAYTKNKVSPFLKKITFSA